MADLRGSYDVNDEPAVGFEVLPAGEYAVKVDAAEWKETKNGRGRYLQINMVVAEGERQGALLIERLNLVNDNATAVKIARGQFAALRDAVGVKEPKDTADLENIRFRVAVKCERSEYADPQTGEVKESLQNRITRYLKYGEAATAPQQAKAPWKRNAPRPPEPEDPGAGAPAGAGPDFPF